MIKSLTGGDLIPAEIKGSNEQFEVLGNFNILISSNADLTVNLDSDVAAWRRRLLWIRYDNPPVPDDKKIVNFDDVLLAKEGSGILNWALQGAKKVIQSRGEIALTEEHKKRIEDLLLESDSVAQFVKDSIQKDEKG